MKLDNPTVFLLFSRSLQELCKSTEDLEAKRLKLELSVPSGNPKRFGEVLKYFAVWLIHRALSAIPTADSGQYANVAQLAGLYLSDCPETSDWEKAALAIFNGRMGVSQETDDEPFFEASLAMNALASAGMLMICPTANESEIPTRTKSAARELEQAVDRMRNSAASKLGVNPASPADAAEMHRELGEILDELLLLVESDSEIERFRANYQNGIPMLV
jgi:hypothetical protein